MERWASLYLLKLRYGDRFGTHAGGVWRILYTLALMPWMRKYRVYPSHRRRTFPKGDSGDVQSDEAFENVVMEKQALQLEVKALQEENRRMMGLEDEVKRLRRSVVVLEERIDI